MHGSKKHNNKIHRPVHVKVLFLNTQFLKILFLFFFQSFYLGHTLYYRYLNNLFIQLLKCTELEHGMKHYEIITKTKLEFLQRFNDLKKFSN